VYISPSPLSLPAKGGARVGSVMSREAKFRGPGRSAGELPIALNSVSLEQCLREPRQEGI
jgi:hypothetical protein